MGTVTPYAEKPDQTLRMSYADISEIERKIVTELSDVYAEDIETWTAEEIKKHPMARTTRYVRFNGSHYSRVKLVLDAEDPLVTVRLWLLK